MERIKKEVFVDHEVVVVVAIISRGEDNDKEYLIAQRAGGKAYSLKWEFPGGKYEDEDETREAALVRELAEELRVRASVGKLKFYSEHEDKTEGLPLAWFCFYECDIDGDVRIDPNIHTEARWVSLKYLRDYDLTPATQSYVNTLKVKNDRN